MRAAWCRLSVVLPILLCVLLSVPSVSNAQLAPPVVSPPGGRFDVSAFPFKATLAAGPGTQIRYTLADRDPDPKCMTGSASTNNRLYREPIRIGNAAKLRAVACSADAKLSSPVVTVEYAVKDGGDACFSAKDNQNLPYRFLRNGQPPAEGEESTLYPFTEITSGYHRLNPRSRVPQYAYNAANRCHGQGGSVDDYDSCAGYTDAAGRGTRELRQNAMTPVFSLPSGKPAGARFTSHHSADACTLAQTASGLQYPPETIRELTQGTKLRLVSYADRESAIPRLADANGAMEDVCVLHGPYPDFMRGISLDFEVHDGRAPAMTRRFLTSFVQLVHGKNKLAILRANPLTSSSQQVNSGLRGNENYLQSIFDFIDIEVPRSATTPALVTKSLSEQLDLLKNGPAAFSPKRVYVLARPAEVHTVALAEAVRDFMFANDIAMLAFGGTPVALGGSCDSPVNQVLRTLTAPRR